MAVIKDSTFAAPSTDKRSLTELDSVVIESGVYFCEESRTILNTTSDRWTVSCISTNTKDTLHCFTQIWIPGHTNTEQKNRRLFIRTAGATDPTYSTFSTFITSPTDSVVELYVGGTQPPVEAGITKIWFDLS